MSTSRGPDSCRAIPATPEHLAVLVELMREFYAESSFELTPGAAARGFQGLFDAPARGRVWLLEVDAEPAGFIVLTFVYGMEYGALKGFVDDFFVRSRFRRRGVGALALATVRQACDELGVGALLVETSLHNEPAMSVYRRAGFDDLGRVLLSLSLGPALHEQR